MLLPIWIIESGLLVAEGAFVKTDSVKPVAVAVLGTGANAGVAAPVENVSLPPPPQAASDREIAIIKTGFICLIFMVFSASDNELG
ncbi:hypothetical protein LT85_1728 [Collimonas arenae]|uniref:Uncharacterized protein n=1 Tax=Collimonas arenae TaxID=279058 RepID=A0A0A1F8Q3_9BURK|nr:hypothetical protein [Collimonas arenae]AIY40886.1 hypothetical protein LT85_1728 [Collimonas arenae]